ncbi:MAG TPA: DNA methyltransferase [Blastocatellia bacterium]|nr:DNA methyltransferase [Blastocatellia bacterium]
MSKKRPAQADRLLIESSGQLRLINKSTEQQAIESQQVECLGMTFESDEARREYFLDKLREKLNDPEFRKIEGFPLGEDEDILRLSDPPYYTACPNPFLEDFIRHYGKPYDPETDNYRREPFATDVSEGKNDPIYNAHSYHTKVPHKAIMRYILHYTEPGDVVLDGFAGSGMTGVAAQMCGSPDAEFKLDVEGEYKKADYDVPRWGARRVVLNDLDPAATFISANYNLPFDVRDFAEAGRRILKELELEIGWMYETLHTNERVGHIEYTVWSEVFTCPECAGEVVFLDEALDAETKRVKEVFPCPHCRAKLSKDNLDRMFETKIDTGVGETWKRIKLRPSLIQYRFGRTRYEKIPDELDKELLSKIEKLPLPISVPTNRFPIEQMYHGSRIAPKGFTRVHHFFLPRAAQAMGALWKKVNVYQNTRLRNALLFWIEQAIWTTSILNRYRPTGFSQVNQYLSGVYYVASQHSEVSPWYILNGKLERLEKAFSRAHTKYKLSVITTCTAATLGLSDQSIDYIFTDPPFGENIYYADLNFLVESWHRVWTNAETEAIVDQAKDKELQDYKNLMQSCFEEYYRVLKPGRWMTVVFHNSRNSVWNAIQEAMLSAKFVVADVRTLDKQQGSYRQVTSTAVKQDLVITAYKPNGGLENRFELTKGTEEGAWDFVRTHLKQVPIFVSKDSQAEVIAERQNYLLFDRMVAFHVQRNVTVPMSAAEFYAGLDQRFPERDSMYFLPEQVAEYDKKRATVKELGQLELIPRDEDSAIKWIRQQLLAKPQTFQELQPNFMKAVAGWAKYEKPIELSEMLAYNFLSYDGRGDVPSQIHSYLSTNYKDLRNLPKDAPALRAKAKDRWYVPDPNKASDLEKQRERALLREFDDYRVSSQKKIKVFRIEAVRAGFKKAWQDRQYETIIEVAKKIPEDVLQEDPKLLMWYDQALTRTGE